MKRLFFRKIGDQLYPIHYIRLEEKTCSLPVVLQAGPYSGKVYLPEAIRGTLTLQSNEVLEFPIDLAPYHDMYGRLTLHMASARSLSSMISSPCYYVAPQHISLGTLPLGSGAYEHRSFFQTAIQYQPVDRRNFKKFDGEPILYQARSRLNDRL